MVVCRLLGQVRARLPAVDTTGLRVLASTRFFAPKPPSSHSGGILESATGHWQKPSALPCGPAARSLPPRVHPNPKPGRFDRFIPLLTDFREMVAGNLDKCGEKPGSKPNRSPVGSAGGTRMLGAVRRVLAPCNRSEAARHRIGGARHSCRLTVRQPSASSQFSSCRHFESKRHKCRAPRRPRGPGLH